MRLRVDDEKCQGHNRCYALAPELFDVDDYGYAHEIGDGTVPAGPGGQGPAGRGQLPRVRRDHRGGPVSGNHSPVQDWATDFDHTDAAWAADPFPIWDELRAHLPGRPLRALRRRLAPDPPRGRRGHRLRHRALHVSQSVVVSEGRPMQPAPQGIAPPISSDPPFHHEARRLLLPAFSPKAVERLEQFTRDYCNELIDRMAGEEVVDAATEYAQHIPVLVIAHMLGFPAEDADQFRMFVKDVLEGVDLPMEQRFENFLKLDAYLTAQVEDHIEHPRDDLTSFLLNAEMDGRAPQPRARGRHHRPAPHRRHRHHLERHRRVAVAPGPHPRPTASGWSPSPS